jgi:hypothetical protein
VASSAELPADRRLRASERVRLAIEILSAYRQARAALRETSIGPAVQALRTGNQTPASEPTTSLTEPAGERAKGTPQANPTTLLDDTRSPGERLSEAWRLGRAVQLTLRLAPGDTRCLTRSLVLTQLLARRSIPAKLVIGARPAPSFLAHAWVECDGHPVLPTGESSFGRLVEL